MMDFVKTRLPINLLRKIENTFLLALEMTNEPLVYLGTGLFGITTIMFNKSSWSEIIRYVGMTAVAATTVLILFNRRERRMFNTNNLIFITGCDSGLGYNMAKRCHSLNMTVIAGVLNRSSKGAKHLAQMKSKQMIVLELDIKKPESILLAHQTISQLIDRNNDFQFSTLVNNAGIMIFGEFEWQTASIIESQISVNLLGTMRLTHELLPLLRKHKGRVINVTSHCGLEALPGLAPYAASKAGLVFWTNALRMEMRKYGVDVVNFVPGSFIKSSNIFAGQEEYFKSMIAGLSIEQQNFHGTYINEYKCYLKYASNDCDPLAEMNERLMKKFEDAVLHKAPNHLYKYEPWRYKFYHSLFKIVPECLKDNLIERFMMMPKYCPPQR